MSEDQFIDGIERGTATVAVVGLGYVGLPIALAFHQAGMPVIGFDVDRAKLDAIARGVSYISHIPQERIAALAGVRRGSPGPRTPAF